MILFLQILSVFVVIALFKLLPQLLAGLLASSIFITVAGVSIYFLYEKLRFKSFGIYIWAAFLICIAIPMLAFRITYLDLATSEIFIGPVAFDRFHKVAEKVYVVAFFVNAIDYIRIKKATK